MPFYNYICLDCVAKAEEAAGCPLTEEEQPIYVFETRHMMFPTPEEIKETTICPVCLGLNTKKTNIGTNITGFVRGCNWEEYRRKNASAMRRDMNLYQLQTKDAEGKTRDPYAEHRQPGEVDHIVSQLGKESKHNTDPKHFIQPG